MAKKYIKDESRDSSNNEPAEIDVNNENSRRSMNGVKNTTGEPKDSRDTIALILSIIFVAALGFFGYQYFNNADVNLTDRFSNIINIGGTDRDESDDISSDSTTRREESDDESNVAGDTDSTNGSTNGNTNNTSTTSGTNNFATGQVWVANDYDEGDIDTGNYTVQYGDTLWELAEGAYGDGAQWTRILEANSDSVGFLANGQQALIITGQSLVIPV